MTEQVKITVRGEQEFAGAEKDVMGMIFAIKTHFQLFNIEDI